MDSASNSYKSNNTGITEDLLKDSLKCNVCRQLHHLILEENLISKSIGIISKDLELYEEENNDYVNKKVVAIKLRTFYIEIRDLFEEIKANTVSQDIKTLDIEDVKRDVIKIENKIKCFKTSLHTQLKILKESEEQLVDIINGDKNEISKISRRRKLQPKSLKEIVPSPVKTLINSPMKCAEVEEFQHFLASSRNRYGGWIPYNHNIFEKLWQKYFCTQENIEDYDYQEVNVENSGSFGLFVNEVCHKISDISIEDIIAHNKWYTKYVFLRKRQQRALEKWKTNRRLIKKSRSKDPSKFDESKKPERLCRLQKENVNEIIKANLVTRDVEEPTEITIMEELNCDSPLELYNIPSISNDIKASDTTLENLGPEKRNDSRRIRELLVKRPTGSHRRATEQWNNRCIRDKESCRNYRDIDRVPKRRIPDWRLVIHTAE